jgi:hypothetical protein
MQILILADYLLFPVLLNYNYKPMRPKPNLQRLFPFALLAIIQFGILALLIIIEKFHGLALISPMICFWLATVWALKIPFWSEKNISQFSLTLISWLFCLIIIILGWVFLPNLHFLDTEWGGILIAAFLAPRFFHWQWGDILDRTLEPGSSRFAIYPTIATLIGMVIIVPISGYVDQYFTNGSEKLFGISEIWFTIPAVFWQITLGYMLSISDKSKKLQEKIEEIGR